jgi:tetratricopeptide (TPR) repeat protein
MKQLAFSFAITIVLAFSAHPQKLGPPKLDPTPETAQQKALIAEGIALHDKGDYAGAISRYEQVLQENPNSIGALYEESFSYYTSKDYKKCLEKSYQAAQYKSDLLPAIYVQIGSALDELGDSKKAVETYKTGLKLFPTDYLLHFNLAVTYNRLGDVLEARTSLKKAAGFNPDHAGSQLLLSVLFDRGGYRTPSLLAACRFLILEPATSRSDTALALVRKAMQAGVSQGNDAKTINIFIDTAAKKDEGDFTTIDLIVSMTKAAEKSERNQGKSAMQLMVGSFETLFAVMGEQKGDSSKFTWKYYVPYFVDMKKQGHVEAFAYYANRRSGDQDVSAWLLRNQDKVHSFLAWSRAYAWPRMD